MTVDSSSTRAVDRSATPAAASLPAGSAACVRDRAESLVTRGVVPRAVPAAGADVRTVREFDPWSAAPSRKSS